MIFLFSLTNPLPKKKNVTMKTIPIKCYAHHIPFAFLAILICSVSAAQFKRVDHHVYFASNKEAVSETVMINDDIASSYFIAFSTNEPYKGGVMSFSGELTGKTVMLKWELINPPYIREVVVERSINGSKFLPIGKIKVPGKMNKEKNSLQFRDEDFKEQNVSYRLQLTCKHYKKQYSNVLKVDAVGRKNLSFPVYSDATNNKIIVNIDSEVNEKTRMMLIDNNGRMVKQKDISLSSGENNFSVDGLDNLSPGNYHAIIKKKGNIYTSTFSLH